MIEEYKETPMHQPCVILQLIEEGAKFCYPQADISKQRKEIYKTSIHK